MVSIPRPAVSDHVAIVSHQSKLTASSSIQDGHQLKPVKLNIVLWYIYILKHDLIILRASAVALSHTTPTHHILSLKCGGDIEDTVTAELDYLVSQRLYAKKQENKISGGDGFLPVLVCWYKNRNDNDVSCNDISYGKVYARMTSKEKSVFTPELRTGSFSTLFFITPKASSIT